MTIKKLTDIEFDTFSKNHKLSTFYQTTFHGKIMKSIGFEYFSLGLIDDEKNIIAATLILSNTTMKNFKYGYAPRGFLIDYKNKKLLNIFTIELRKYLKKHNFIYITIDPPQEKNYMIEKNLRDLKYVHYGYNKEFETLKPRYNAIINLDDDNIYPSLNKTMRKKIKIAIKKGVEIHKGDLKDIPTLYNFIEKKHIRTLKYYQTYYEILKKEELMDIYIAKINPQTLIEKENSLYYKEKQTNDVLNNQLLTKPNKNTLNNKMNSDRELNKIKNNIKKINKMTIEHPQRIEIAALAIIKHNNCVYMLINGFDEKYKDYNASHLMIWSVIEEYIKKDYTTFNLNGITETKKYKGLTDFKLSFGAKKTEYIGEYTLILMPNLYHIKKKFKSMKLLPK